MQEGRRRIVIASGGTGGHLYPALAVADAMRRRWPQDEIVFVGSRRGLERELVPRAGYPLRRLRVFGMKGRSSMQRAVAAAAAAWAVGQCAGWMLARRPALVLGAGGYASGPAVLAAHLLRIKTMVLEQNHFPGATNRWLARRVDAVCVPSAAARERLGGRGHVTGNPVRAEFLEVGPPPGGTAMALLVFGGSRGARSINRAVVQALPQLERFETPPRVVHQTGVEDEASVREAYHRHPRVRAEVRAYLDDMPARLAAADLVLCRAGAMTLAELAAAGRPALLVPYPHAADDHQRHNAEAVAAAGAAQVLLDTPLDAASLVAALEPLARDPARRQAMGRAARALARPDATAAILTVVAGLLGRAPQPPAGGADVP